jgi:glycosyltransferase involved in cell wall biosynthesis
MKIFYYHPLALTFTTGQTIQIFRFYGELAKNGHRVVIYGTYSDEAEFQKLYLSAKEYGIEVIFKKEGFAARILAKIRFIGEILKTDGKKILVTRHHKKSKGALWIKMFDGNVSVAQEVHEIHYLMDKKHQADKRGFYKVLKEIDGVVFISASQLHLLKNEENFAPQKYVVLPCGADNEKFLGIKHQNSGVLTYFGQLNDWKNVPLLFETLSLLPQEFSLRIAGGKGDSKSKQYVDNLIQKHNLFGRVDFLGFVPPDEIEKKAIVGSNVLLLPLGDNVQSKSFTSPIKLFEYLMTDIPIVAVDYPTVSDIANEKALTLSENSAEKFAEAVIRAVNDGALLNKIEQREILRERYSMKNRVILFQEFACQLLGDWDEACN